MNTSTGTKSSAHANLDVTWFQNALWGLIPKHPKLCPPPGLAIMMQLARELKTLAKEFSIAIVVSVAAPCPLRAGVCHGEEPWRGFGALGRGDPAPS